MRIFQGPVLAFALIFFSGANSIAGQDVSHCDVLIGRAKDPQYLHEYVQLLNRIRYAEPWIFRQETTELQVYIPQLNADRIPILHGMAETTAQSTVFIKKFSDFITGPTLEVGPYFLPILTKQGFPNANRVFWEYDSKAIEYLRAKILNSDEAVYPVDLNNFNTDAHQQLFQNIIVSQVMNYVDYEKTLKLLHSYLKPGGMLFIANAIDYGTPEFFHDNRPGITQDYFDGLEKTGFEIVKSEGYNMKYTYSPFTLIAAKKTYGVAAQDPPGPAQ